MNIICRQDPSLCSDPSVPQANYSSESPDGEQFYGRNYGTGLKPPLGPPWIASSCLGTCVSTISQEEANACAQRNNISCLSVVWPVIEDNPTGDPPTITVNRQTYFNDAQSCEFECPDGQVFTYTIPAGTVAAFSQAAADVSAHSMACNKAIDLRICIGDVTPAGVCVGEEYSGVAAISAPERPGGFSVNLQADSLPPGLSMEVVGANIQFSGTTTASGEYPFTVQVEDELGNFMQKTLTIFVREVLPATLPEGTEGNNYSATLTFPGASGSVTWEITGGALPGGTILDETTGTISGVPSNDATFTFTATGTDSLGSCSKEVTLVIQPGVRFDQMIWTQFSFTQTGQASASFTPDGTASNEFDAATSVTSPVLVPSQGQVVYDGDLNYVGPNRSCRVIMQITNVQPGIGVNSLVCTYFLNAVSQAQVTMVAGFNGELHLNFTAMTGAIKIRFNMLSAQGAGNPSLSIACAGLVTNL